jgi:RHS repeat-associated protein
VREVVKQDGTLQARYDYDAYGMRSAIFQTAAYLGGCTFGYTGHITLPALVAGQCELVLTHYRAYDPQLGRWLSADPIGEAGGINLYEYVGGDPMNLLDPLGLEFWSWNGTAGEWAENAAQFSMGMGDHFSFGLNRKAREAIYGDDYSDPCSGWYKGGGYTGAAIELAATGGSIAATRSAVGVSARQLAKDRRLLRKALNLQKGASSNGKKLYAHHTNPLKGHPGGSSTMFPSAGLPSSIKNSRFNGSALTHSQHMAAHQRLKNAETVARAMGLGNAPIGAARTAATALRNSNCD